ncbi:MAG: dihydrolipoyl dehydrogenase [Gammaproteobacteria bacterium RBG_16_51_14]|nr:MAG: dihydrolipoyl dehydrogenase [Gammaproteobacteria bacterium RBG_16_51_14]
MPEIKEVRVPDIGDFEMVEIIEVLVATGDRIEKEQSLITLESDKATLDIPSPCSGVVKEIHVTAGDRVSKDSLILTLETSSADGDVPGPVKENTVQDPEPATASFATASVLHAEVVVMGAGPGGYTAAFRSADLGRKTVLIERYPTLGGVCLNVGCIPSKALLHIAKVITEIHEMKEQGIDLGTPRPDRKAVRQWVEGVVNKLTGGLRTMARQRKVEVIRGTGYFLSSNTIQVEGDQGTTTISFDHAIIAAGSHPAMIPGLPDDPRIMDSTAALLLESVPGRMLVIGGGIIGLEMATVYEALGSRITVVEMLDTLMTGCDRDILRPLQNRIQQRYENIYLQTVVREIKATKKQLQVFFAGKDAPEKEYFDAILVAVGRRPNGKTIGAEQAGVRVDEQGFIPVDDQQRTNIPHIFAIGDIAGQPMLAHKATHEGKIAAEVIAGLKSGFDGRVIPAVAYTDPEIAWVGLTEDEAKKKGIDYGKGVFPWAASGRSLSLGRDDGLTKILFDKATQRIIGLAVVGPNASDVIAEGALAIEMGCDAQDIGLTIHPHPTLSETVGMAAEAFAGTITDLYIPKR